MSGFDETGTAVQNKQIDVFTPSPDMNGVGTLTTVATRGGSGPPEGELYPRMFVMPDGRNLVAGPDPYDTWSFTLGPAPGNAFNWSEYANFDTSPTSRGRLEAVELIDPRARPPVWLDEGDDHGRQALRADAAGPAAQDHGNHRRGEPRGRLAAGPLAQHRALPSQHRAASRRREAGGGGRRREPQGSRANGPSRTPSARSSSSIRPPTRGSSAPLRPRAAPITRPPS